MKLRAAHRLLSSASVEDMARRAQITKKSPIGYTKVVKIRRGAGISPKRMETKAADEFNTQLRLYKKLGFEVTIAKKPGSDLQLENEDFRINLRMKQDDKFNYEITTDLTDPGKR